MSTPIPGLWRAAWQIARKDLLIETETKDILSTTTLFAALVVVLASLSFYLTPGLARQIAPGVIWVAVTFAGLLAVGRSWGKERDGDALRALLLTPAPRGAIFLGKLLANIIFLLIVEGVVIPMVALFFHVELFEVLAPLSLLVLLGTIGFAAPATLFGAMGARGERGGRDLALSIVVFPLITPALLAAVVGTKELFAGAALAEIDVWLRILISFDAFFLFTGVALFGPLLDD